MSCAVSAIKGAVACAAAFLLAAGPALATPAIDVLERDFRLFQTWLPGDYDNAEQFYFATETGVPTGRLHETVIPVEGKLGSYHVVTYVENDPAKVVQDRVFAASVDKIAGAIRMEAPGCVTLWRRNGNQFIGETTPGSCGITAKAVTKATWTEHDLWIDQARLQRSKAWTCWISMPHEGKPDSWFYASGLKISDQGGEVWVKTDDAIPKEVGYRLRQVDWPTGTNQNALTLYIFRKGEAKAVSYAWADPNATRIGINLRWMQGSCSR